MSIDEVMSQAQQLVGGAERAAAAGAYLRWLNDPDSVHPALVDHVCAIGSELLPGADALGLGERTVALGMVTAFVRQAIDLLEHPGREPGWDWTDPMVLQAQGRASASVARVLAAVVPSLDGLASRLSAGGSFCDVGTGVGWLAIAAARAWPQADVVGIDVFEPALTLARSNVAAEQLSGRIDLRLEDVRAMTGSFDLVWLPGPFLTSDVLAQSVPVVQGSLRPGGWVAVGLYGGPDDGVGRQLGELRTIRSGGSCWTPDDVIALLRSGGFVDVTEVERRWGAPLRLVVGQRH